MPVVQQGSQVWAHPQRHPQAGAEAQALVPYLCTLATAHVGIEVYLARAAPCHSLCFSHYSGSLAP